jgi:hypothetical protein
LQLFRLEPATDIRKIRPISGAAASDHVARSALTGSKEDAFSRLGITCECRRGLCWTEETDVPEQIVNLRVRKREGRHLVFAFPNDVRDLAVGHAAQPGRIHERWRAVCALSIGAVTKSAGPRK